MKKIRYTQYCWACYRAAIEIPDHISAPEDIAIYIHNHNAEAARVGTLDWIEDVYTDPKICS